mgnify:CR=1 FL=1
MLLGRGHRLPQTSGHAAGLVSTPQGGLYLRRRRKFSSVPPDAREQFVECWTLLALQVDEARLTRMLGHSVCESLELGGSVSV